jgi:IclR family transcriptional regulator, acetate operon repressor
MFLLLEPVYDAERPLPGRRRGERVVDGDVPRGTLGTVRNASTLLDLLGTGPAFQQLTDLAERSGMSLPTVHRLLRSLVAAGLVEQDPRSSRYSLGPELVRLAQRYLDRLPVLQLLGPYLADLRGRTAASTAVALLVRGEVVYVDRADPADPGLFRRLTRVAPAPETAGGRLLLARAAPAVRAECLARLDGSAPADGDLAAWGAAPHLVTGDEATTGELEVAVPLVDAGGATVAALVAMGAPPTLTREGLEREVVPLLLQTAALAGRMLPGA